MTKAELYVAVLTAGLAFAGAIAGVTLGSNLDQKNWERRFELEQKRALLEKRIAAVERVVVVVNKAPVMVGLQASLESEKSLAKLALTCASRTTNEQRRSGSCRDKPKSSIERIEGISKEIHTLGAEYAAAVTLAATYFGPETRKAVAELKRTQWWQAEQSSIQALVDAMGRELNAFPE